MPALHSSRSLLSLGSLPPHLHALVREYCALDPPVSANGHPSGTLHRFFRFLVTRNDMLWILYILFFTALLTGLMVLVYYRNSLSFFSS
jgi:hypothetical protein